jgi:hypothetical protein
MFKHKSSKFSPNRRIPQDEQVVIITEEEQKKLATLQMANYCLSQLPGAAKCPDAPNMGSSLSLF